MAANKKGPSFDEIIQAARQRRKQQAIADKIFGKNRGSNAPASKGSNNAGSSLPGGPLAARVEKRSATSGVKKPGNGTAAGSSRAKVANNRRNRDNRAKSSQTPPQNAPVVAQQPSSDFNIKGRASGPAVVIGSNFAPGTTAEDIQSAFEPVGGTMLSCRVISTYPAVVAEMTFVEPSGAEAVVASFNNQKADGRILHLRVKQAPLGSIPSRSRNTPTTSSTSAFDLMRELADRERRLSRRAEPQIQDGRYGFGDSRRDYYGNGSHKDAGLYSDRMMLDGPERRYR